MYQIYTPTKVFFTKGVGKHKDQIHSEQLALKNACIEDLMYRLLDDSGVFPYECKQLNKNDGLKKLKPGNIVDCILMKEQTSEANRLISVSIGLAVPNSNGENHCGYIIGHKSNGMTDEQIGKYVEDTAATRLALRLGIDFDINQDWNEREKLIKSSGKILKTQHYTQSAEGDKAGLYTSIVVAAIYLP